MDPFKIDIPVLIIFFARPEPLAKVFEQIKLAKPSKLYLYQDGPREDRTDDIENINKCRQIVKDITWKCQVYCKYQHKNYGCDPSEYIAQKWMFENEEFGIVLEDDDVPSQSFFPFCKEILERYKDDERMGIICGMNNLGTYGKTSEESYFFTKSGSIWGWATWKRNVDLWDENYTWLSDKTSLSALRKSLSKSDYNFFMNLAIRHKNSGNAHYETILAAFLFLQNKLNIVPRFNMISNVGLGENGTHALQNLNLIPKGIRKIFYMKIYELGFPLIHPRYITEDKVYKKKVDRQLANGYPLIKFSRLVESTFYRIVRGDFISIIKGAKRRLRA
ncbi:MAG: hemolysin activation protein [Chitinophagaceae bacterium]|nr:MAG: hemolysin activation protein [Chitinophagaceae bacterium]